VSISTTFYARFYHQYPFSKKSQSQTVIREKLREAILYKKQVRKMLMKLSTVILIKFLFPLSLDKLLLKCNVCSSLIIVYLQGRKKEST